MWGDADYARRFSKSCGLSGSAGFQINTPLALKYGYELSHKEPWHTFRKPELRHGSWEDERFWMWYIVYGRLGYNPETDPAVWRDEFTARFGAAGPLLEQALSAASKILPMITTIHMPVHPSLRYWTELNTGWALFAENNLNQPKPYDWQHGITYGSTEPSDHGLFYGVDEYVADLRQGKFQGKYSPLQAARWLDDLAAETLAALRAAGAVDSPEYRAMSVDLNMLADLARYHADKLRAATALALWRATSESARLSDAALLLDRAIAHWKSLAEQGSENYYHDLNFSSAGSETRRGTWADLTKELEADRATLAGLLQENGVAAGDTLSACYEPAPLPVESRQLAADLPETARAGCPLRIEVTTAAFGEAEAVPVLHYRHTDQTEGLFHTLPMERTATGYAATIPADYVTSQWDLQLYVTIQGPSGACVMLPGLYHPIYPYPYHVVTVVE